MVANLKSDQTASQNDVVKIYDTYKVVIVRLKNEREEAKKREEAWKAKSSKK